MRLICGNITYLRLMYQIRSVPNTDTSITPVGYQCLPLLGLTIERQPYAPPFDVIELPDDVMLTPFRSPYTLEVKP